MFFFREQYTKRRIRTKKNDTLFIFFFNEQRMNGGIKFVKGILHSFIQRIILFPYS